MNPNPLLKKLGFSKNDRIIIIHADDLGMCQSTITACKELFEMSGISSAAVMVPCPWFLSAAGLRREVDNIDLGVHVTLTSEWKEYRWKPISSIDIKSGLFDSQGYFHATSKEVQNNGNPAFVREEINAQINKAMSEGILPTHIDTHMGAVAHPKFMFDYINAGLSRKIPPMLFRLTRNEWMDIGLDESSATIVETFLLNLEGQGVPLLDHLRTIPLDEPDNRFEQAVEIFDALPPGITHFIIHPATETPELKAITSDWKSRVGDFQLFRNKKIHTYLRNNGIHVVGYQEVKSAFPISVVF
ncbi:MAG: polysaccharide deacetylase family protein [Anaerolineaceae bacterium]|nr:polysaccharide deacetylase family protein [Anaerolineaceae bacterium]